jgi:hypothetical protein
MTKVQGFNSLIRSTVVVVKLRLSVIREEFGSIGGHIRHSQRLPDLVSEHAGKQETAEVAAIQQVGRMHGGSESRPRGIFLRS